MGEVKIKVILIGGDEEFKTRLTKCLNTFGAETPAELIEHIQKSEKAHQKICSLDHNSRELVIILSEGGIINIDKKIARIVEICDENDDTDKTHLKIQGNGNRQFMNTLLNAIFYQKLTAPPQQ